MVFIQKNMKKEDNEDKKWSSEYPNKPLEEALMEKLVGVMANIETGFIFLT